jgi:hypothetical protein
MGEGQPVIDWFSKDRRRLVLILCATVVTACESRQSVFQSALGFLAQKLAQGNDQGRCANESRHDNHNRHLCHG